MNRLKHIAKLIREGNREGHYPAWQLVAEREVLEDSEAVEVISKLVADGFTEGYHPRWELKQ